MIQFEEYFDEIDVAPDDNMTHVLSCKKCGSLILLSETRTHVDWHREQDDE